MSILHKALEQADHTVATDVRAEYNPLSTKQAPSRQPYLLLGGVFFFATLAVLLWPTAPDTVAEPVVPTAAVEPSPITVAPTEDATPLSTPVDSDVVQASETLLTQTLAQQTQPASETSAPERIEPEPAPVTTAEPVIQDSAQAEAATAVTAKPVAATSTANKPEKSQTSATVKVNDATVSPPEAEAAAAPPEDPATEQSSTETTVIRASTTQWQQQVKTHIAAGEIEQAETLLKRWISALPNEKTPRIWLAQIYINNGFYRAAEPLLNDPNDSQMAALSGIIYERTERFDQAAAVFERLHYNAPDNPKWLLFWAINSENEGQLVKATTLYQNYLSTFAAVDSQLTAFAQQRLDQLRRP